MPVYERRDLDCSSPCIAVSSMVNMSSSVISTRLLVGPAATKVSHMPGTQLPIVASAAPRETDQFYLNYYNMPLVKHPVI